MSLKVKKLGIQVSDIVDFGTASGVSKLVAGTGISLAPVTGIGTVTITNAGVTSVLVSGGFLTLTPVSGVGTVTITLANPLGAVTIQPTTATNPLVVKNRQGFVVFQVLNTVNQGISGAATDFAIVGVPANINNIQDPLVKFVDTNGNGVWDIGETIIYDADSSGTYSAGDSVISGTAPALGTVLHAADPLMFEDDIGALGVWTAGDTIFYDLNGNSLYDTFADLAITGQVRIQTNLGIGGLGQPSFTLDVTGPGIVRGSATIGGLGIFGNPANNVALQLSPPTLVMTPSASKGYVSATGALDPAGNANTTMFGFFFQAALSNTGPGAVTILQASIMWLRPSLASFIAGSAITAFEGLRVDFSTNPAFFGTLTIPTERGLYLKGLGSTIVGVTYTTVVGLDIDAIGSGTNKIGIRQSGSGDTSRFAGNVVIGSVAVAPTEPLRLLKAATNPLISGGVVGEANFRVQIQHDRLDFGPGGASALDLEHAREALGIMHFKELAGNSLTVKVLAAQTYLQLYAAVADAQPAAKLGSNTGLQFGPGGAVALDTFLQRTAANQLDINAVLRPSPDNTYDIGTILVRWRHGFYSGSLRASFSGNSASYIQLRHDGTIANIETALAAGGDTTLVMATEILEIAGSGSLGLHQLWLGGSSLVGIIRTAALNLQLNTNSIVHPDTDNLRDLGETTTPLRWRGGFFAGQVTARNKPVIVVENLDETQASATVPNADTTLKSYALPANSYTKIIVEAEGYITTTGPALSAQQDLNIKLKAGASQIGNTVVFNPETVAAGGKIPFTIKATALQAGAATLALTIGAAVADVNTTVFANSFRVYGES